MLIEFVVSNFRSIKSAQTFSLVKGKGKEHELENSFSPTATATPDLLRSAAIYGANAAGKSNFIAALSTMESIVIESAAKYQPGDELPVTPFRLDESYRYRPSEFEVSFVAKAVRYQYGFSATRERIHSEWLLAYPKGKPQRWFERTWQEDTQQYEWEMGSEFKGQKQLWMESTRANALFLSTAAQLNSEQLSAVYEWFKHTLRTARVGGWYPNFSASLCEDSKSRLRIVEFLKAADLGIDDIEIVKKQFDPQEDLPDDMPESLKEQISKNMEGKDVFDVGTIHRTPDGRTVRFDLDDESDGTKRFFAFAGPWLDSLEHGYVLFIDELHDHFHPKLVQFLVDLFHNSDTNPNNAQLVFTTHETSILSQEIFRRDQIWFCEKNESLATELIPLSDFKPRKGRENLELSYLAGRYGALPYVRKLNAAVGAADGDR